MRGAETWAVLSPQVSFTLPIGLLVDPLIAAAATSLSSVSLVGNALRLWKTSLESAAGSLQREDGRTSVGGGRLLSAGAARAEPAGGVRDL